MEKQSQRETSETDLVQPQPTCRFLFSSQGGALLRFGARLELDPIHVEGLVHQHDKVAHRPQRGIGETCHWTLAVPGAILRREYLAIDRK